MSGLRLHAMKPRYLFAFRMSVHTVGVLRTLLWFTPRAAKHVVRDMLISLRLYRKAPRALDPIDRPPDVVKKGLRVMFTPSDNTAGSGAFRSMVELARQLRDRHGVDPFIVLPCVGDGTQLLTEVGLPFVVIPSSNWTIPLGTEMRQTNHLKQMVWSLCRNSRAIAAIRRLIRRYQVDLVHVNTTWTYVGAIAAQAEGVPCIWHLREYLEEDQARTIWSRSFGNRLIASCDKAIAISNSIAVKYCDQISESRLVTIYNGVNREKYHRPEHVIMQSAPYTFVFLGNFKRHKGHVEFAMACAKVFREGFRSFRIWFVGAGDPDVRAECETIFAEAGMEVLVTYHGFQKTPEVFLENADVAFTCSRFEAWGRVTAEAMMAGCLVVGSDTGATPELIADGESGFLFHYEPGQCDSLASKVKEAVEDVERSRRIAMEGRKRAVAEMTSTRNADAVFALYQPILDSYFKDPVA